MRTHFGVRSNGAAQVYVDPRSGPAGPVHDVHVESSLFTGSNPDMFFAVNVRQPAQSSVPLASGVEFVNNTIVSANIAAIVLADEYAKVPSDERPLIENNILGRQKHSLCGVARTRHERDRERRVVPRGSARHTQPGRQGAPLRRLGLAARRAAPPTGRRRRT